MQADADDHYRLLLALQETDSQFNELLKSNHNRRQYVDDILHSSNLWKNFAKTIQSSMWATLS